nr:hypothetical protein [Tanacetum cinerariifolium]
KGNGCFECEASGHFKRDCPKLMNKNGGNRNAQGWVYAVGNAPMNLDSNVVMGTFLLNNRYASILFETSADRSFISTAFSSLKLEIELWNLKVKGNDVPTYTNHFQELTLICTKFVANENEKIDKYISGLPDSIYGNVKSSKPRTLDETIELTNNLMDQKLHTYAKRADNKRKTDETSRNNHGHQQQPFKKHNFAKVYNMGTGESKPYEGSLPNCTKCQRHHNGPCTQKSHKCNKETPKGNGCFECEASGHFKRDCPKLMNKNGGNRNAQGWVYAVGNAPMNLDSNVVMGTFLLNNRYASILFETSADRSFISTAFSSLVNIDPTPLGSSYDVESQRNGREIR